MSHLIDRQADCFRNTRCKCRHYADCTRFTEDKTRKEDALATDEEINRARQEYAHGSDDNIEIDEEAKASRGDDGVWVAAWVWLSEPYKPEN